MASENEFLDCADITSHNGKRIRSYTAAFKLTVIKDAEPQENRAAARKFDVHERSVREWRGNKESIVTVSAIPSGTKRKRIHGGGRKPQFQDVDNLVLDWITSRRERGLRVSRKLIMKKALVVFDELKLARKDDAS